MPTKSVTVKSSNIKETPTYEIEVTCPYCGEEQMAEEDYCEPDEWHCDLCNKKFKIKYENDRTPKAK